MTGTDNGHETRKIRYGLPAIGLACRECNGLEKGKLLKRAKNRETLFLVLLSLLLLTDRGHCRCTSAGAPGRGAGKEGGVAAGLPEATTLKVGARLKQAKGRMKPESKECASSSREYKSACACALRARDNVAPTGREDGYSSGDHELT